MWKVDLVIEAEFIFLDIYLSILLKKKKNFFFKLNNVKMTAYNFDSLFIAGIKRSIFFSVTLNGSCRRLSDK